MLRIGFLPSDFNPMLLVLGEAGELRALAGVLRQFARTAATVRLDTLAFCRPCEASVTLMAATGELGVTTHAGPPVWRLDSEHALAFASRIESLADPAMLAGSELLECGVEEEIPVKVSRGEYTDDFLLPAPML